MTSPISKGVHHLGLSVLDLSETKSFFENVLGFNQVGGVDDYPAAFMSDGHIMITLWQVANPETATHFDRKNNVGLHHFALYTENSADLDALYARLKSTTGVAIEFTPEFLGNGPAKHMMCTIPGGIRMEVITLNSKQ